MSLPERAFKVSKFIKRFNPKAEQFLVRKKITCEFGVFQAGEIFLPKLVVELGFLPRRIKVLYDQKFLLTIPEGQDLTEQIENAKEKMSVFLLEKANLAKVS